MLNIPKEVKDLFKQDSVRKNIRIHFPNGERADITNSNLIAESFSFTESVMSQSEFRFGLCEASMVEFECFGVENIKGYEIEVSHEIDISSLGEEFIAEYGMTSDDVAFPFYRVPYGEFKVEEALKQADMSKRKVNAYSQGFPEKNIPNSVESAKFNQIINCRYKNPYNFNVYAFMYANTAKKYNPNLFDEKELDKITSGRARFMEGQWGSKETIVSPDGSSTNSKYIMYITVDAKREIFYEENKNLLCELGYSDLSEADLKEIYDTVNSLDKEYIFLKSKSYEDKLNVFYMNMRDVFFQTDEAKVGLNGYHYIYPYIGYSANEISYLDNSQGYLYEIIIPHKVIIEVEEVYYNEYGVKQLKKIYTKEIEFRKKENEFVLNKITNLPKLFMNITRVSSSINGNKRYSIKKELDAKNLVESTIEFSGCFGKHGRNGDFELIQLNNSFGLYPSEDLYPSETLYPREASGGILTKGNYLSAWYDDEYTKPYDRVSVSYKNADGEEMYAEYLIVDIKSDTYNASDYQAYSLSENYLIQNGTFTEAQITEILQTVGEALRNIRYMPCEIDAVGMPWVEAGDGLEIVTNNGAFDTLVLNRRINGIQRLIDNIEAN